MAEDILVKSSDNSDEFRARFDEPVIIVPQVTRGAVGEVLEWAAYIGPAARGADWVRANGDKVPQDFAKYWFPNISGRYRF